MCRRLHLQRYVTDVLLKMETVHYNRTSQYMTGTMAFRGKGGAMQTISVQAADRAVKRSTRWECRVHSNTYPEGRTDICVVPSKLWEWSVGTTFDTFQKVHVLWRDKHGNLSIVHIFGSYDPYDEDISHIESIIVRGNLIIVKFWYGWMFSSQNDDSDDSHHTVRIKMCKKGLRVLC